MDAVGELPTFQQRLLDHLGSMSRGILRLDASVAQLERRVEGLADSMDARLTDTNAAMVRVEESVATIVDMTPDPDAPGPIAKAKEAITGHQ